MTDAPTKQCPYCAEQVRAEAVKCRHCGSMMSTPLSRTWYRVHEGKRIAGVCAGLAEEFGISVSDDTVYRMLKAMGFAHLSARPKAYRQDAEVMAAFKKTSRHAWRRSAGAPDPARSSRSGSRMR